MDSTSVAIPAFMLCLPNRCLANGHIFHNIFLPCDVTDHATIDALFKCTHSTATLSRMKYDVSVRFNVFYVDDAMRIMALYTIKL